MINDELPIKDDLNILEENLKKLINKQNNFLKDDLYNFMFSAPKRLRPILVFLFSKILNIEDKNVQNIALALELIHSASLIHDDILDEDRIRRNNLSFYGKFGPKIAVLEGDLLLSLALEVLSETSLDILKIFSKKIKDTINGELEQNSTLGQVLDEESYLKKTFNKTGNLFLAGLEALFCLGDFTKEAKNSLINYTKNFSLAFQLKNDIKGLSFDIKNRNYTLVVLYFLQENSIDKLNDNLNFDKYIKKAHKKIEEYKNLAQKSLDNINDTPYKRALIKLSELVI